MLIASNHIVCINSSIDFWKLIYEIIKKKTFHHKNIYIYGSQAFWSFIKFYFVYTYCKGLLLFFFYLPLQKSQFMMLIFLCICMKHSQYYKMRQNNSKWNLTKNCQTSWFSCRQLKISECSISLAWLGKCSKSKIATLQL